MKHSTFIHKYKNESLLAGSVRVDSLDLLGEILVAHEGSYLVVDDSLFDRIFSILYYSNVGLFCVATNLRGLSPSGFYSHLDRAVESFYGYLKNNKRFVLINRSCFDEDVYRFYSKKTVVTVDKYLRHGDLLSVLEGSSYNRVSTVSSSLEYAVRGGVIDLYPASSKKPLRVDFSEPDPVLLDFDLTSQVSVGRVGCVDILIEKSCGYVSSLRESLGDLSALFFNDGLLEFNNNNKNVINLSLSGVYSSVIEDSLVVVDKLVFNDVCYTKKGVKAYPKTHKNDVRLNSYGFEKIKNGDLVVHDLFGVARYSGVVFNDNNTDSSVLLDFEDGRVQVDIGNIDVLSVIPPDGPQPPLSSISKKGVWRRKVSSIEKLASSFVDSVLQQHLKRTKTTKVRAPVDNNFLRSFVDSFKYADTPDQKSAWDDVLVDLSSSTPMDRLLCGDVGFGKTEIAMRAAFYSVLRGGRVLVVAPTTVLSNQLLESFRGRLGAFGVSVDLLSRVVGKSESLKKIKLFNNGQLDIIVGTHRIISNLKYLKLVDLIIVDEEHRFGVKHKQSFVETFPDADVLSMSATPIPRSLQKALSGIKTISTISTPPVNRQPIQTVVEYYNVDTIVRFIKNETLRGGQVYFLHNDIKSINHLKNILLKKDPSLSVEIIHGKMTPAVVKKIINDFIDNKFSLLISTTIIENGIDIKNVNTIIINNAHLFGLSQLHQIRGRVGRGGLQSYAYLLIPKEKHLTKKSYQRLRAVEKNTALGSGYFLSMKDLELRGGGALFGYAQSGGSVYGFDLYNKILKRVLGDKKGVGLGFDEVLIDVFLEKAHIPSSYIQEEGLRIDLYKQISSIDSQKRLDVFFKEIANRFGEYSRSLKFLYNNQLLKIIAHDLLCVSISKKNKSVELVFLPSEVTKNIPLVVVFLKSFTDGFGVSYKFKPVSENRLCILFDLSLKEDKDIYMFLFDLLNKFKENFNRNNK